MKNNISGRSLCRLRMVKGIPQKLVALRLNMSQQAYSKIESTRSLKQDLVDEILMAIGSNMTELRVIQQLMNHHEL